MKKKCYLVGLSACIKLMTVLTKHFQTLAEIILFSFNVWCKIAQ